MTEPIDLKPGGLDENATGSKKHAVKPPFTHCGIAPAPWPDWAGYSWPSGEFSPTSPQTGNFEYIYKSHDSPQILINPRLRLPAWVTPNHCYSVASSALYAKHSHLKHSPRHSTLVSSLALTPPQSWAQAAPRLRRHGRLLSMTRPLGTCRT